MAKTEIILSEIFYALTVATALFFLLEIVWPGLVLSRFNPNWLLLIWLIIGIVVLIKKRKYE